MSGGLGWGELIDGLRGREPRRTRLPISFLPGRIGVVQPGLPALLLLGDDGTRRRCLRALLETELASAPVMWLGADEADIAALGPVVDAAARRGRLQGLAWTPEAAATLRDRGLAYLVRELVACGLRRRELLLVDLLPPWIAASAAPDVHAVVRQGTEALRTWAGLHRRGPMLALAPASLGGQALLPLFERSELPCLAQLQQRDTQVHFEVVRWADKRQGTVQDLGFGLVERADGGWQADGSGLALDTHALVTAGDADRVITLAEAVPDAPTLPPGWEVCASMDELVAACRFAVAACVLLPHRGTEDLPLLVDVVRQLRAAHPHALKIVVREVGGQIRYNQELALARLGANTVVYRNVGLSRLLQTLAELRNQTYSRRLTEETPQEVLTSVAPEPVHGYLPVRAFCDAAERMLERAGPLGLSHCMVQLPLLPHVAHLDALGACQMSRDGDLLTADAQTVWLFLFACRAPDVEGTLARIFLLPFSELFSRVQVRPEPDSMQRALARLRRDAVDAVTDYSDVLQVMQPPRLEVGDSGFVKLHPPGLETQTAPLDEADPTPAPARAPESFELKLRP